LHFNAGKETKDKQLSKRFFPSNDYSFDIDRLIAIDTIRVDDHVRLTLTRKVRQVFPINAGDILVIFQDKYNSDELFFKIQRDRDIVYNWVVKRKHIGGIDNNSNVKIITSLKDDANRISYNDIDHDELENINKNSIYTGTRSKLANIILIDDEEDVLYAFKSVLSSRGYNVKPFRGSKEALKYLFGLKYPFSFYDLAIIDIRMPDINGIQFYQILKVMNQNIRVLFISALDAVEEALSAFPEIKLDHILRKPTSQTQLVEKVNEILAPGRPR
jgi:CheY-like chemotaxis protein